jgi:hypothetical protein
MTTDQRSTTSDPFRYEEDKEMMKHYIMKQLKSDVDWDAYSYSGRDRSAKAYQFRFENIPASEKELFCKIIFEFEHDWTFVALNNWIKLSGDEKNDVKTWDKLESKVLKTC